MTREELVETILEAVAPAIRNRILTNVTKSHMSREGAATARLDTRHHPQIPDLRAKARNGASRSSLRAGYKNRMKSAVAGSAVNTERREVRSGPSGLRRF